MKQLPEKFIKKGFKHHLLKREDNVAIYKRQFVETSKHFHYEVVIITTHNGITIDGNYIEPGELYPSTSQWGNMGWTCNSLEQAEQKFKQAIKQAAQTKKTKEANSKKKKK
jgi:hypothetical protein